MKKRHKSHLGLLGLGTLATAYTIAKILPPLRPKTAYDVSDTRIASKRGSAIYCTTVVPRTTRKMPLIVLAHGFGADRQEGGRFAEVAEQLAAKGIASIRPDFPGCNQSEEPYSEYRIRNMLDDVQNCIAYMMERYSIDEHHLGLVGYSMGGRLATIYAAGDPRIKVMALWAPALTRGYEGLEDFMGGKEQLAAMIAAANARGSVDFNDPFGGVKELGQGYFVDMESYDPIAALSAYKHDLLIVQGNQDTTVKPEVTGKAIRHIDRSCYFNYLMIDHADHGFGLWDNHPEQSARLVKATVDFFDTYL